MDIYPMKRLFRKIDSVVFLSQEEAESDYHAKDWYCNNVHLIYHIISLLMKANELGNFKDWGNPESIQIYNHFVSESYEFLTKACQLKNVAKAVWSFNSSFFTLKWKNKICNDLHYQLFQNVLKNIHAQRFTLDSLTTFKHAVEEIGHTFPIEVQEQVLHLDWQTRTMTDEIMDSLPTKVKNDKNYAHDYQSLSRYLICQYIDTDTESIQSKHEFSQKEVRISLNFDSSDYELLKQLGICPLNSTFIESLIKFVLSS